MSTLIFLFLGALLYFIAYLHGFNGGCQYYLDIYTGKRWVKNSKNPFKNIKE